MSNLDKELSSQLQLVGWREFVSLPELGIPKLKAKVDTGARSSSLHASRIHFFEVDGKAFVRFKVYPLQRRKKKAIITQAPLLDKRLIKSSSGEASVRPVILTTVELLGQSWQIEVTLADRTEMGFRMLLGREAVRGRFLVDSGNSYYGGIPKRKSQPDPPQQ